jgi:hypothetical protein
MRMEMLLMIIKNKKEELKKHLKKIGSNLRVFYQITTHSKSNNKIWKIKTTNNNKSYKTQNKPKVIKFYLQPIRFNNKSIIPQDNQVNLKLLKVFLNQQLIKISLILKISYKKISKKAILFLLRTRILSLFKALKSLNKMLKKMKRSSMKVITMRMNTKMTFMRNKNQEE